MIDKLQEIFISIARHRTRTILTAVGIAWGIFVLTFLLAMGNGFENAIQNAFAGEESRLITVYGGTTSKEYKGLPIKRRIKPTEEDMLSIQQKIEGVNLYSIQGRLSGSLSIVRYKDENGRYTIWGTYPDYLKIKGITAKKSGRLLNKFDNESRNKVVMIGSKMVDQFFKDEDPIGKYIILGNQYFKVVGVFQKNRIGNIDGYADETILFMPYRTMKQLFKNDNYSSGMFFTPDDHIKAKLLESKIRRYFASVHGFDITDDEAVSIRNNEEEGVKLINGILMGIKALIWIVGLATLMGGIIGISNIMLVTVKERTREIGICKSIGASPKAIISAIILESAIITTVAGYIGLMLSFGLVEGIRLLNIQTAFFYNPEVNISIVVASTVLLISSGIIAGLIPARNAARVRPVVALRQE